VQIIEQNGTPVFAVVPIDIWEKLRESVEDIEDVALYDKAKANDSGFRIPHEIVTRTLVEGENAVKVWREYRGLTLELLASSANISKAYLSQIENGKRHGTLRVMKSLAKSLDVPLDILVEDSQLKSAA
jgi:DNA-binding XRE family transcriptional regulator